MFDPAVYNVWHKAASCQTLPSVLKKNHWDQANLHAVCNLAFIRTGLLKNWSMFSARISSYGCTWEVWRAREKRKSCLRRSREQLLLLQCSRNSIIAEWRIGIPLNGFLSFFLFFFFIFIFFATIFFSWKNIFFVSILVFLWRKTKALLCSKRKCPDTIVSLFFDSRETPYPSLHIEAKRIKSKSPPSFRYFSYELIKKHIR